MTKTNLVLALIKEFACDREGGVQFAKPKVAIGAYIRWPPTIGA